MFLTKEPNGYYYVYHTNIKNGKRTKISTKTKNSIQANKFFTNFQKEYKLKMEGTKFLTIAEFLSILINNKKNYFVNNTINNYKTALNDFDRFLNYKLKLHEVKQEHIDNYSNFLFSRKLKNSSVRYKLMILENSFKFALKNKYVNELFDFPKITVTEYEKEFLTKQEFISLLEKCNNKDLQYVISITFMTGLRLQEAINLQWNSINLDTKYLLLDNKTHITKTKKIRNIPMTNDAFNIITRRFNTYQLNLANTNNEYVFTYNGKKWHTTTLQMNFKKLVLQVFPNKKLSFHNLRHSFASNLILAGVPILVVSKLLGHASINSTQVYSHLTDETLRTAIQNIDIQEKEKVFNNN
jgi:site-specific recombinase XerD